MDIFLFFKSIPWTMYVHRDSSAPLSLHFHSSFNNNRIPSTLLCTAVRSSLAPDSRLGLECLPNQRPRSYVLSPAATRIVRKMGWYNLCEFGLYVCALKDCLCGWDLGSLTYMEKGQRECEIYLSVISGNF